MASFGCHCCPPGGLRTPSEERGALPRAFSALAGPLGPASEHSAIRPEVGSRSTTEVYLCSSFAAGFLLGEPPLLRFPARTAEPTWQGDGRPVELVVRVTPTAGPGATEQSGQKKSPKKISTTTLLWSESLAAANSASGSAPQRLTRGGWSCGSSLLHSLPRCSSRCCSSDHSSRRAAELAAASSARSAATLPSLTDCWGLRKTFSESSMALTEGVRSPGESKGRTSE